MKYEKWDATALIHVINHGTAYDNATKNKLLKIYNEVKKHPNKLLLVKYKPSMHDPLHQGRLFAENGVQNLPAAIKRLCMYKYYDDLDIVNCYPVLLEQITDIETKYLKQYNLNRDEILLSESSKLNIPYGTLKKQFYILIFGGQISSECRKCKFLREYATEIASITNALWNDEKHKELRDTVMANKEKENKTGTFVSDLIMYAEKKCIDAATDFVGDSLNVSVYCFDGFLVKKGSVNPNDLPRLSEYVEEKTGYKINFVFKDMTPTSEDYARYYFSKVNNALTNPMHEKTVLNLKLDLLNLQNEHNELQENNDFLPLSDFVAKLMESTQDVVAFLSCGKSVVIERTGFDEDGLVMFEHKLLADARNTNWAFSCRLNIKGEKDPRKFNTFNLWFNNTNKVTYTKIVFKPFLTYYDKEDEVPKPNEFNLFVGFALPSPYLKYDSTNMVQAENGPLKSFIFHIKTIWCRDDPVLFEYTIKWLAANIQNPSTKLQCCLVLKSQQGAGKGCIVDLLEKIMGSRYVSRPPTIDSIVGDAFNSTYFKTCLLCFLDEICWGGDKSIKNKLKTKITDDVIQINEKYKDSYYIKNRVNFIMATNEDHYLSLEGGQRRYLVLELDNRYSKINRALKGNEAIDKEAHEHFKALRELDLRSLANYLNSIDLTGFLPANNPPSTRSTVDQIVRSFATHQQFLLDVLSNPSIIDSCSVHTKGCKGFTVGQEFHCVCSDDELEGSYVREEVMGVYNKRHKNQFTIASKSLWEFFESVIEGFRLESRQIRRFREKKRLLYFPKLDEARKSFKRNLGIENFVFDT